MAGLSSDPRRRSRQLANLRRGGAPPAPAGNQRHKTHGAFAVIAAARLETKTREVFDALAQDAPLRDKDGGLPREDTVAVLMLAKALCRLEDVEQYLTLNGLVDGEGEIRPAVDHERRLRAEVGDALDALGMTPRARAKLGLDVARAAEFSLAQAMSSTGDDVIEGEATDA